MSSFIYLDGHTDLIYFSGKLIVVRRPENMTLMENSWNRSWKKLLGQWQKYSANNSATLDGMEASKLIIM